MPHVAPHTRAQTKFLRAFRQSPAGPPPHEWPAPDLLRRWLRQPRFKRALTTLRDAIRFQTDFHLAAAASAAARTLQSTIAPDTAANAAPPSADTFADAARSLKSLTDLLRLAHVRERFAATADPPAHSPDTPAADDDDDDESQQDPRLGSPKWNPKWTDAPHVVADIFAEPDRLKNYLLLLTSRGRKGYEQFLAAFPDELDQAIRSRDPSAAPPPPAAPA